MEFAFSRKSPRPGADLRRIALDRLAASLALGEGGASDPAAIHELRRNIKRLRAVIALCRPDAIRTRRIDRALGEAGRLLAPLRESDALTALFDSLAPDPADPTLSAARLLLSASAAGDDPAARAAAIAAHSAALATIRDEIARWRIPVADFAELEDHFRRTRRNARALMEPALADPRGETLHDWRKRVKTHGLQVRLLHPIRPARIAAEAGALDRLGDLLGEARDCAILAERLEAADLAPSLVAAARQREADCLAAAAPAARALLGPGGKAQARRWRKWWAAWKAPGGRKAAARA
ncbi:MAG: CHAD domain-containing protein [Proteobacteria bacterium]|nr:CHAD domain-containing protein [Pseudomonadota bacterium]MBS0573144.1 CHAD domain-containing protein [Pseudomonadota bacterium]